ncbi:hypothetical protein MKW92_013898 [Papaver armeniacum]|nr:hypothetical protein MKW92_013898 [Papaver armeniacum]
MKKCLNEHPALHKKVVDEGIDHLVLITYHLYIYVIVLAPMAYFLERRTMPKLTFRIVCLLFVSAISGYVDTYIIPFPLVDLQNTATTFICAFVNMVPLETVNMRSMSGNAKVFLGTIIIVCEAMVLTLYKLTNFSDPGETTTIHHRTINHINWLYPNNRTERGTIGTITLVVGTLFKIHHCQYSSTALMCFLGVIQSTLFSLNTYKPQNLIGKDLLDSTLTPAPTFTTLHLIFFRQNNTSNFSKTQSIFSLL